LEEVHPGRQLPQKAAGKKVSRPGNLFSRSSTVLASTQRQLEFLTRNACRAIPSKILTVLAPAAFSDTSAEVALSRARMIERFAPELGDQVLAKGTRGNLRGVKPGKAGVRAT
jgi:hypothetical protein